MLTCTSDSWPWNSTCPTIPFSSASLGRISCGEAIRAASERSPRMISRPIWMRSI